MIVKKLFHPSEFRVLLYGVFILIVTIMMSSTALAQKTDQVFLHNGDRVTGDIKELIRGELRISTDTFGTIYVSWADVEHIVSDKRILLETSDGTRYFGPIAESQEPDAVSLDISGDVVSLDSNQLVFLQTIKENQSFVGNIDNSLSVGFTYAKASDVLQWHVNASSKFRAEKYLASLSYNAMITNNGTGQDSERRELRASYNRWRGERWFWFGTGRYQENDELGIDGRFLAAGGIGRYLAQSNRHEFYVAGGLAGNWEKATDPLNSGGGYDTTAEGFLRARYSYFKLHTPKSVVDIDLEYLPSLSTSNRERGSLNVRFRQEFVKDLFWNLSFYGSFDTAPPEGAFSEEDYGVVTGLEYLF